MNKWDRLGMDDDDYDNFDYELSEAERQYAELDARGLTDINSSEGHELKQRIQELNSRLGSRGIRVRGVDTRGNYLVSFNSDAARSEVMGAAATYEQSHGLGTAYVGEGDIAGDGTMSLRYFSSEGGSPSGSDSSVYGGSYTVNGGTNKQTFVDRDGKMEAIASRGQAIQYERHEDFTVAYDPVTKEHWMAIPEKGLEDATGDFLNLASFGSGRVVSELGTVARSSSKIVGRNFVSAAEKGAEVVKSFDSFNTARSAARKAAGLGDDVVPFVSEIGPLKGRVTGSMSSDGLRGWRLDYDSGKGFHVNWWDRTAGPKRAQWSYGANRVSGRTYDDFLDLLEHAFPK